MSGTNMRNKFRLSEYLLLKLKEIIKYKFYFFPFCVVSALSYYPVVFCFAIYRAMQVFSLSVLAS